MRWIPKADGRQRPLGVTALEDKVVQRAVVKVLNAIYESDFLGFSYGFRPRRNPHNALDALYVGIMRKRVNWMLDADIRGFFDAIDHEWLMKFVEHRIADQRVLRHIKKWLNAGVMEDGKRTQTEKGTPQGGSVSPLLANVYLHYVFDLWVHQWRKRHARGEVIIVRFADDFTVGFQYREDAERFLEELRERFQRFHLELHPKKTRLMEFGRYAAENRKRRGEGKPESFDFLGFTHTCDKTRNGKFIVLRQTMRKRLQSKLFAVGTALTGGPPHRSQRALLTHWAPTSGHDAQSLFGIRVQCSMLDDFHQPSVVDGIEESTDVRVEYPVHFLVNRAPLSRQATCRIRSSAFRRSGDRT